MRALYSIIIFFCLVSSCGSPVEQEFVKLQTQSSSDLLRINQSGRLAVRLEAHSAYYQRVLQRQQAISLNQLSRVKPTSSLAVQIPKGLPSHTADDIASMVRSAMRRPNRNVVIGALVAAGVITAIYVLDDENEQEEEQLLKADIKSGIQPLSAPRLLNDAELQQTIRRYQPSSNAIARELSLDDFKTPPASNSKIQALRLKKPGRAPLPKVRDISVQDAERIPILQLTSTKSIPKEKGVKVKMALSVPPVEEVKILYAYFYDETGAALQGKGLYKDDQTGGARASAFLFPLKTSRDFTAEHPFEVFLPYSGVEGMKKGKRLLCRIYWPQREGEMQELGEHYFTL